MNLSIIGAGGHAKSVVALCERLGHTINSLVIPDTFAEVRFLNHELTKESALEEIRGIIDGLVIGIGISIPQIVKRNILESFQDLNFQFPSIVSPDALIDSSVEIGQGSVVFPGAIVNRDVGLNPWLTLGHRTTIEHDSWIGRNCFVGPGVIICGGVKVEDDVVIGAGSILLQGTHVGYGAVIGAGAVVTKDVPPKSISYGNPAKVRDE